MYYGFYLLGVHFDAIWVSLCPKNLQSVDLNWIFLEFKDKLFGLAVSHIKTVPSCVFSVAPCITMSSVIPSTPGTGLSSLP